MNPVPVKEENTTKNDIAPPTKEAKVRYENTSAAVLAEYSVFVHYPEDAQPREGAPVCRHYMNL